MRESGWGWLVGGVRWRFQWLVGKAEEIVRGLRDPGENPYVLPDGGYDAGKYWADRHSRYRHSFRGVGNASKSEEENLQDYSCAVETVADLLTSISFDPRAKACLDIGCGNGFWAGIFKEWGVTRYTGVDITDALFDRLRALYPEWEFLAGDMRQLHLSPPYQLISMIDVTQHITDDLELLGILKRVRHMLAPGGVFIVTLWNETRPQKQFYEVFRSMEFYTQALRDLEPTEPRPFRDKFIVAFFHPGREREDTPVLSLSTQAILGVADRVRR